MSITIDYKSAGVDIDAADRALEQIAAMARETYTPQVLAGVGPFSGLYSLDLKGYAQPLLVSSADGVGTKLKLALRAQRYDTIGADLVNHCIDDILTCGAKPLMFQDYLAMGRLEPDVAAAIVRGIADACKTAGVALIGGETAEMPGLYKKGDFDLAGFVIGMVDGVRVVDGQSIEPSHMLVGLASNGPHTNGYSLIRKVLFDVNDYALDDRPDDLGGPTIGEATMAVHTCYLDHVRLVREQHAIHGMAHITGGGIGGNLVRILPENCQAVIDTKLWEPPPIFPFIRNAGNIALDEMFHVFNMGIGYILVVERDVAMKVVDLLSDNGHTAWMIGHIIEGRRSVRLVTPK